MEIAFKNMIDLTKISFNALEKKRQVKNASQSLPLLKQTAPISKIAAWPKYNLNRKSIYWRRNVFTTKRCVAT